MTYILYNPIAGGGSGKEKAEEVSRKIQPEMSRLLDVTTLDLHAFFEEIPCTEAIVLAGGDGTINRFINRLHGVVPAHQIYYYPAGSGNDFWNDVKSKTVDGFILLNRYLEKLPIVEVNGEKHFFVNGVGYGIDGYCCEVGDRMRDEGKKNINYASIAIKGLLGRFKTSSATVTVDGIAHRFSHVWLAPTMNGRYYGGGMDIAPHAFGIVALVAMVPLIAVQVMGLITTIREKRKPVSADTAQKFSDDIVVTIEEDTNDSTV